MEKEDKEYTAPKVIASTYKIIERIGSGGGGVVYLANHLRMNKLVVLKADKRKLTTREDLLRREVDTLKKLSHTYIPQVYDFFVEDDTVYTVIDYIEGESLDKPLKRGERFSQPQVIKWGMQLLEALCYLHNPEHKNPPEGFVHSDIKPANIMCRPNGDICLIDFNIALALGEANAVGRSPGYASPEHYGLDFSSYPGEESRRDDTEEEGTEPDDPDPTWTDTVSAASSSTSKRKVIVPDVRSDIYSLGATLYHFLSGQRPARNAKEVTPLSEKEFSPSVVRIIAKAMEPNPDLRYQTAEEMLTAFRELWIKDPRMVRLKKCSGITAGVLAAVLVAGVGLSFIGLKRMQTTESWKALAEYSRSALRDGDLDTALAYALRAFPQDSSVLQPEYIAEARNALTNAAGVYDLSDGYKVHGTIELPSAPLYLAVSPDGTTVSAVYSSAVAVYDTESCELLAELPAAESALAEAAYLAADTLIYAGKDGISRYDIGEKAIRWSGEPATEIRVSADGTRAAAIYKDESHASVYDTETGQFLKQVDLEGRGQSVVANDVFANPNDNLLALNSDGSLLAVSLSDGSLEIYDLNESGRDMMLLDDTSGYTHFEGGFYGQYFAFSASNTQESVFAVVDMETGEQTGGFQSVSRFSVQADETGIYVQTENLFVQIDPVTGEQRPLVTTYETINAYARDAENTLIATEGAFAFYGTNAVEIAVFEKQDETDFAGLAGGIAVLGSRSSPILRLMKYENHPEAEVFSYDPLVSHDEARISADRSRVMLFDWQSFYLYDIQGDLLCETEIPNAREVYDQQFRREGDESYLEILYNDGTVLSYSVSDGSLIQESKGDAPASDLYEEFYVNGLRIESPLHGAATAYDAETGRQVGILAEKDYLTYVTSVGENFVAQFTTADGYFYGQLLNNDCEVLAELPYLCDVIDNVLIFDYPTGDLRQSHIYDIGELIIAARSVLGEGQ